jgi:alpha-galactosidase
VYVNIDDGWQGTRGPDGALRPNAKFPDMKALADYVHARGLKLGLYSSPGPKTCAGYEGSYGHVAQDAQTFAAWGADYLKYDLCSGEWFYQSRDEVQRSYQEMGAALRATGRAIVYSLCEYGRVDVATWGRQAGGHLWRTTGDIEDNFASMAAIGFDRNPRFPAGGPGGWNDPDMLEIGNGGMSATQYRTHLTLWAMSSAPLLMGHDVRSMDTQTAEILTNREVIAVDQDGLGAQGAKLRAQGSVEIWRKPLADGGWAIALFNRGEQSANATLTPAETQGAATARDLWAHTPRTVAAPFALAPHASVLLRFSAPVAVAGAKSAI